MEPSQPHSLPTNALQMGFSTGLQEKYNHDDSESHRNGTAGKVSHDILERKVKIPLQCISAPQHHEPHGELRPAAARFPGAGVPDTEAILGPSSLAAAARGLRGSHAAFENFELACQHF